jgi:hypothetical protein
MRFIFICHSLSTCSSYYVLYLFMYRVFPCLLCILVMGSCSLFYVATLLANSFLVVLLCSYYHNIELYTSKAFGIAHYVSLAKLSSKAFGIGLELGGVWF